VAQQARLLPDCFGYDGVGQAGRAGGRGHLVATCPPPSPQRPWQAVLSMALQPRSRLRAGGSSRAAAAEAAWARTTAEPEPQEAAARRGCAAQPDVRPAQEREHSGPVCQGGGTPRRCRARLLRRRLPGSRSPHRPLRLAPRHLCRTWGRRAAPTWWRA
jgi:hypothetical protein